MTVPAQASTQIGMEKKVFQYKSADCKGSPGMGPTTDKKMLARPNKLNKRLQKKRTNHVCIARRLGHILR
jgi:hypothetical protein